MDLKTKEDLLRRFIKKIAPSVDDLIDKQKLKKNRAPVRATEAFEAAFAPDDDAVAMEALEDLAAGRPLSAQKMSALEAIIIPDERPVVDIIGNEFDRPEQPFGHFFDNRDIRLRIDSVIPSVGRIELPNQRRIPYAGTGFVVGKNLLMSNRHVAELFCSGLGQSQLIFRNNQAAYVNFQQEIKPDAAASPQASSPSFRLEKLLMIHPYWDMALFQTEGLGKISSLILSTQPLEDLTDREIALIGYPALDTRNNIPLQMKLFRGVFNVKRLQPGKINGVDEIESFGKQVKSLTHDATTLGGNSGSLVLDVKTGHAVGLHFAGIYLKSNYAVPTFSLAQDSRVAGTDICFESGVKVDSGPWQKFWTEAERLSESESSNVVPGGTHDVKVTPSPSRQSRRDVPSASFILPLKITVSLNGSQVGEVADGLNSTSANPASLAGMPEGLPPAYSVSVYESRNEYKPDTFGLPDLTVATGPSISAPLGRQPAQGESLVTEMPTLQDEGIDLNCLSRRGLDLDIAVFLARASQMAYTDDATSKAWSQAQGFSSSSSFNLGNIQGFWCKTDSIALLAFRGTSNVGQWLRDARFLPALHPWGLVHGGFLTGLFLAEGPLQEFDEAAGQAKDIWITGHSLGGALAVLAAARLKITKGLAPSLYTYGQPRVGFSNFADRFGTELAGKLYRFVNQSDIVPRVPPGFLYQHCGILKRIVKPGILETINEGFPLPTSLLIDNELPPLTEQEFLQVQMSLETASTGPGTEIPYEEGIMTLPLFHDHFMNEYIQLLSDIRNSTF